MSLVKLLDEYLDRAGQREYFSVHSLANFLSGHGVGLLTESTQPASQQKSHVNFKNIGKVKLLTNKVHDNHTLYCQNLTLNREKKLKFTLNSVDYTLSEGNYSLSESGDPLINLKEVGLEDSPYSVKLQVNPILGEGFTFMAESTSHQPRIVQLERKREESPVDEFGYASEILEGLTMNDGKSEAYVNAAPNATMPLSKVKIPSSAEEIKSPEDLLLYASQL